MYVRSYARSLYLAEGHLYQDGPHVEGQLRRLADRIIDRIGATIADIEESGVERSVSLAHHGLSTEQMLRAARNEVDEWIEKRLPPPSSPAPRSLPLSIGPQVAALVPRPAAEAVPSPAPDTTEIERRKSLLDQYKIAVGGVSNRKIYESRNSGIHKPQFYEWLHGVLPNYSETAKNFERFLHENKLPIPRG